VVVAIEPVVGCSRGILRSIADGFGEFGFGLAAAAFAGTTCPGSLAGVHRRVSLGSRGFRVASCRPAWVLCRGEGSFGCLLAIE